MERPTYINEEQAVTAAAADNMQLLKYGVYTFQLNGIFP
jgi:hypothetical protein